MGSKQKIVHTIIKGNDIGVDQQMSASYRFEYADVLNLSSVIDVVAWNAKHDSYYRAGKAA